MSDFQTLSMALVGYSVERQKIEAKIAEVRLQLDGGRGTQHQTKAETKPAKPKKRKLSAALRAKLATNLVKARRAKARKAKAVRKAAA